MLIMKWQKRMSTKKITSAYIPQKEWERQRVHVFILSTSLLLKKYKDMGGYGWEVIGVFFFPPKIYIFLFRIYGSLTP